MGNPWAPPEQSPPAGVPTPDPTGRTAPPQAPPGALDAPQQPDPARGTPPPVTPGPPTPPAHHAPPPGRTVPGRPPHGVPHPPYAPRPTAPPDPAGVAAATRTGAWSVAALLASVLLMTAPWPGLLLAPVAAVAALALAIVAAVRANRARARGPVVALPVLLVVASLAWVGISSLGLVYVDARRAYEQCEAGALTLQARRTCATQFEVDVRERNESLTGGLVLRDAG